MTDDPARRHSPAAERNRSAIAPHLCRWLLDDGRAPGRLLEIASGTGQHAAYLAERLPGWTWQPTDLDEANLASIRAWCADQPAVLAPRRLDVLAVASWAALRQETEAAGGWQAIYLANLLHIAPWAVTPAVMDAAAQHLAPQGDLVIYGPFLEAEVPTAASNLAFDADLKARDPAWGLRAREAVEAEARRAGLVLAERVAMPANNLLLRFVRAARP